MEQSPNRLLWLDLEMTGLDATRDRILEVAVVITDFNLESYAEYGSGVLQSKQVIEPLLQANPWFQQQSLNYQKAIRNTYLTGKKMAEIESSIIKLVDAHIGDEKIILAGNSIYKDREFVARYLPKLESRLHYRMLDVSAWKVYMQGKYGLAYKKQEQHRALADIHESIAELKLYAKKLS